MGELRWYVQLELGGGGVVYRQSWDIELKEMVEEEVYRGSLSDCAAWLLLNEQCYLHK